MMKQRDFVRQKDSRQCGVAALAMICRIFGKKYSLDFLSKICVASSEGVSMLAIKNAAAALGLESRSYKFEIEELKRQKLPAILYWDQNHFVVLYKVSKTGDSFYIADPAKGRFNISLKQFETHWINGECKNNGNGFAMFFNPTPKFGSIKETKESKRNDIKFLLGYLKEYKRFFIQIVSGLVLGCILQLIFPFLTQSIVDVGIKNSNIKFIWLVLLGEFCIIIGSTATDFIRRWLLLHVSVRINISLVSDFFIKLLKLPMSFFDTKISGDLLQRIDDHSRIQSFLTGQVLNLLYSCLSLIVFGFVLFLYDKIIFLTFLLASVVYGCWVVRFLSKRKIIDYELFDRRAKNHSLTWQFITYIQEIKLQGCGKRRRWEWEDTQAELFETQIKSLSLEQTQEAGGIFINELKNIIITVLSAMSVINGDITLGGMLAIQYIVGQINSPMYQLVSLIYSFQDVKISFERINEIHTRSDKRCNKVLSTSYENSNSEGLIFRNASFKYDPNSLNYNVSDISFNIPAGRITAIVGSSGSGKSTLIKLMLGYYPLNCGDFLLDGKNIQEYDMDWWRNKCGVVMQDGAIFSESIKRNIAVDDGEIDMERVVIAAEIACIHDYIISLPMGYETKIGKDGRGISLGQKQRILIARAVYKNPDYIFLDEATNSLDTLNENNIVANLAGFYKDRTVIIVAHRLSTIKNADNIIVLDQGRISETGNHESLIKKKGIYYNLIRNQLELDNSD